MSPHADRDLPSPVLPAAEVRRRLVAGLGEVDGRLARLRARLGVVVGVARVLPVERTPESEAAVAAALDEVLDSRREGVLPQVAADLLLGLVTTRPPRGARAVVQLTWYPDRVRIVVHAVEAPGLRGAAAGALAVVEEALAPHLRR